ncbi:hypothetical protein JMUB6875_17240 [Nocardia sp. JMUB6875]|uniref:DUF4383 domain-containing protein n=1 Tax=Nocardia sp. JMUB6875 TaxID=3158170 RepID=UPI0032E5F869
MTTFGTRTNRSLTYVQMASLAVGAVFLLVGVLGFIPGIVTDYDSLTWAGHHTGAELLGLFQVSVLHNIIHLIFGAAGLAAARTANTSRLFLLAGGVIYLALWLYGLVIDKTADANFVPVNTADDWLHFGLGLGMVLLGAVLPRVATGTTRGPIGGTGLP